VAAVITLTTDFGTQDSYVAEMKAVILGLHAAVHLVDVTHHVKAHDVLEGALAVEAMAAVGTSRRGLALAAGDQLFVGPDNGIFTAMLGRRGWKAFELRAAAYRRATVSATFHGRDVFAPAAAHLALGVPPSHFGPRVTDPVRLPWAAARSAADVIDGEVIHVDRFGNLVTSIAAEAVQRLAAGTGGGVAIRIAGRVVPLVRTYGELAPQAAGALVGSHGRLEVAVREGSAAARLRAGRGAGVRVRVSRRSTARTSSPVRRGRR
jgi:S-adenosyl-L-methionine hydrolase (adenosine-forming)